MNIQTKQETINELNFSYTPLCDAINNGDEIKAKELIENNAKINYSYTNYIDTPLGLSLYTGWYNIASLIVKRDDLEINIKDEVFMNFLFEKLKNPELVYLIKALFKETKYIPDDFLNKYIKYSNYCILSNLYDIGYKINDNQKILEEIINKKDYQLFKQLFNKAFILPKDNNPDLFTTSILYKALYSDKNIAEFLINNDIFINYNLNNGEDPLITSILLGYETTAELLIEKNIKLNKCYKSALYYALKNNFYKIIELLIKKGVDINGDNNDITKTYLYYFISTKKYKGCLILLENSVKLDYNVNNFEETFLYKLLHIYSVPKNIITEFHQLKNKLFNFYKNKDILISYLNNKNINDPITENILYKLCDLLKDETWNNKKNITVWKQRNFNYSSYLKYCKYKKLLNNINNIDVKSADFNNSYLYEAVLVPHFNNIPLRKITPDQKEVIQYFIKAYYNTNIEEQYYKLCNINNNDTLDEIVNKLDIYVNGKYDKIDEIDEYTTKNLKINFYIIENKENQYSSLEEYLNDINNSKLTYYLQHHKYKKALKILDKNIKLDYKFKRFEDSFLYQAVYIHVIFLNDEPPLKTINEDQEKIIKFFINYYKDNKIIQDYITNNNIDRKDLLNSLVDFVYNKVYPNNFYLESFN